MPQLEKILLPTCLLFGLVVLWELLTHYYGVNLIIFPTPEAVGQAFSQSFGDILFQTGVTALESVGGFLLGSVSAYVIAIFFVFSQRVQDTIYPYAVALKSTPLIALAPLIVMWAGNGITSKIIMSALVAFFPVLVGALRGLRDIDEDVVLLMNSLFSKKLQMLLYIRVPNSAPYVFPALRIASSLAVVGSVIGEFTGASEGVGYLIKLASYNFNTALMFCGIFSVSALGIVIFAIIAVIERRVVFWRLAALSE